VLHDGQLSLIFRIEERRVVGASQRQDAHNLTSTKLETEVWSSSELAKTIYTAIRVMGDTSENFWISGCLSYVPG